VWGWSWQRHRYRLQELVTLTLRPGNYELLCDVPWHYADGMYAAFTVS
jgi:uncharacterized cupredoxin-like copper-binding protein